MKKGVQSDGTLWCLFLRPCVHGPDASPTISKRDQSKAEAEEKVDKEDGPRHGKNQSRRIVIKSANDESNSRCCPLLLPQIDCWRSPRDEGDRGVACCQETALLVLL